MSRIWTFALVLFSFIFLWHQVKHKSILSKERFYAIGLLQSKGKGLLQLVLPLTIQSVSVSRF